MAFPRYVLVSEDSREVLVAAEDVSGFFLEPGAADPDVVFLRAHEINTQVVRASDAVLEVRNSRGERIGEYPIGGAVRASHRDEGSDGQVADVSYRSFDNRCEYAGAARIWHRWTSEPALQTGEWLQWPSELHADWLHVVQNSWFATNHRAGRYGSDNVVHLNGTQMRTRSGFYCALGEAVNGPGGYFGSNLDALADCMSSNFGDGRLEHVVWQDFEISQTLLGDAFTTSATRLFAEFEIDVSLR